MKKNIYIFILAILVLSCGNNISKSKGELVGIKGKKYYPEKQVFKVSTQEQFFKNTKQ